MTRTFVKIPDEPFQYPWVIVSRKDYSSNESVLVERMDSEKRALDLGQLRHDQGFVVNVFYEIAYTEG